MMSLYNQQQKRSRTTRSAVPGCVIRPASKAVVQNREITVATLIDFMDGAVVLTTAGDWLCRVGTLRKVTERPNAMNLVRERPAVSSPFFPHNADKIPRSVNITMNKVLGAASMEPDVRQGVFEHLYSFITFVSRGSTMRCFVPLSSLPSFGIVRGNVVTYSVQKDFPEDMAAKRLPESFREVVTRNVPRFLRCQISDDFISAEDGAFATLRNEYVTCDKCSVSRESYSKRYAVALVSQLKMMFETYAKLRRREDGVWVAQSPWASTFMMWLMYAPAGCIFYCSPPEIGQLGQMHAALLHDSSSSLVRARMSGFKSFRFTGVWSYGREPTVEERETVAAIENYVRTSVSLLGTSETNSVFLVPKRSDVIVLDDVALRHTFIEPVFPMDWFATRITAVQRMVDAFESITLTFEPWSVTRVDMSRMEVLWAEILGDFTCGSVAAYIYRIFDRAANPACPSCCSRIEHGGGCEHMRCTMCGTHFCTVCGKPHMSANCPASLSGIMTELAKVPSKHRKFVGRSLALSSGMRRLLMSKHLHSIVNLMTDPHIGHVGTDLVRRDAAFAVGTGIITDRFTHDDDTFGFICDTSTVPITDEITEAMRANSPLESQADIALSLSRILYAICDVVSSEAEQHMMDDGDGSEQKCAEKFLTFMISWFGRMSEEVASRVSFGAAKVFYLIAKHPAWFENALNKFVDNDILHDPIKIAVKPSGVLELSGMYEAFRSDRVAQNAALRKFDLGAFRRPRDERRVRAQPPARMNHIRGRLPDVPDETDDEEADEDEGQVLVFGIDAQDLGLGF